MFSILTVVRIGIEKLYVKGHTRHNPISTPTWTPTRLVSIPTDIPTQTLVSTKTKSKSFKMVQKPITFMWVYIC